MVRATGAILIVLFIVMISPAVHAVACVKPPGVNGRLNLRVVDTRLQYDYSRSRDQLHQMGHALQTPGANSHISGLTSAKLSYNMEGNFLSVTQPNGTVCLWPQEVTALVGYPQMIVFVDRRYKRGTCEYNVVMEHENQHVRINREALQKHLPAIKTSLNQALTRNFPIVARSPEEAKSRAMNLLSGALAQYIKRMEQERDRYHANLDSPQSYARTQARCTRW